MFSSNLLFFAGLVSLGSVCCIVSKPGSNAVLESTARKHSDNAEAQSIDRDYIAGYDEHYGHGGYGLTAHANYGLPEGHEGYAVVENGKHHVHHGEDHHPHHHHDHHKHYDYAHHKALAIKSLLVPLAGVALLGAAAAFVSNPILLQLGVISGSSLGRRKRDADSTKEDRIRLNELKLLERFVAEVPREDVETREKKILAEYLSCSGMTTGSLCLERLVCELHSAEGKSMPTEANVLTIALHEILDNQFVSEKTKIRLSRAVQRGRGNSGCAVYECRDLENPTNRFSETE